MDDGDTDMLDDYPERAELIGAMQPILKSARSQLSPDWERYGLNQQGRRHLHRLVHRLRGHPHFEHIEGQALLNDLRAQLRSYRAASPQPSARPFAAQLLDSMAREPMTRRVYLGVEHLDLPDEMRVAGVTFLQSPLHEDLAHAFEEHGGTSPTLLCAVDVTAGTVELLRDRARRVVETALALVRQQNLFGFSAKIYTFQVLYALDGRYAIEDDTGIARVGWWRAHQQAISAELSHQNLDEWRVRLDSLSQMYLGLAPALRSRVETCLSWLDVAALSDRWRIVIPAIFSGMEALLVPEQAGLKAELVTVRSVAVHVALEKPFFHPFEIMSAYDLRSDLIHGAPTSDVFDKDATDFADDRKRWAWGVVCDYLELVQTIDAKSVQDVITYLDRNGCNDVCTWLVEQGGADVVREYRNVVPEFT